MSSIIGGTTGVTFPDGTTQTTAAVSSSGALNLISSQTASNTAYVEWTGLTTYKRYVLVFDNVIPASNGSILCCVVGTGTTPTYITSNYKGSFFQSYPPSIINQTAGNFVAYLAGYDNGTHNESGSDGVNGEVTFHNFDCSVPGATSVDGTTFSYISTSPNWETDVLHYSVYGNTTAKTAIKVYFSSSNITSGRFSLYGVLV